MSNSKERFILGVSIFAAAFLIKKKRKAKRKTWARQWLLRRKTLGCYENLMRELALEDTEGYRRWLRMDTATFEEILSLVSPIISKQDTQMRLSIPAGERLSLTLRFLATGETQSSLAYQFRIVKILSRVSCQLCVKRCMMS
ncbi:uncharacterized protein LOC118183933 [Stegodyphus dumicola]|uniref:uncharacterized protein LOC118183933 n=1 Tax=Stegodyphus dumicola TaxID=202533 RepID=UPI0015B137ED|nr:uncharacterized protein LOC118183933 [Stegodyphus dumicola]